MTPKVLAELARLDTLHRAELDRQVVKELRNALRGFDDRVRDLSLPEIATDEDGEASGETVPPGMPLEEDGGGDASESEQEPPGPLHAVSVRPAFARISPGATRSVRARARDEEGRPIRRASFEWRLPDAEDAGLSIETHGARAVLTADEDAPIGKQVALMVVATLGDETVADIAAVEIVEDKHEVYSKLGIPEPVLVSAPHGFLAQPPPGLCLGDQRGAPGLHTSEGTWPAPLALPDRSVGQGDRDRQLPAGRRGGAARVHGAGHRPRRKQPALTLRHYAALCEAAC